MKKNSKHAFLVLTLLTGGATFLLAMITQDTFENPILGNIISCVLAWSGVSLCWYAVLRIHFQELSGVIVKT